MLNKINNWHLSILVLIASIFSLILVQKIVLAQWEDPIGLPGESTDFHLVINPLAEDLELNNFKIFDTDLDIDPIATDKISVNNGNIRVSSGQICLNGQCESSWPTGPQYWNTDTYGINYQGGLVGIGGESHIGYALTLYNPSGDALKMNPGLIWAYQTDLELRSSSDVFTNQDFGIGTTNPNPITLGRTFHIYDENYNAEIDLQSIPGSNQHWSIYHDRATDELRFWSGGQNILALGNNQSVLRNDLSIGTSNNFNDQTNDYFMGLDIKSNAPLAGDCSLTSHYGRVIYDYNADLLYVCDDTGWKSISVN